MDKIRHVVLEKEELKTKIKTKETKLSQLKSTSWKDEAAMTEELDTIESELGVSIDIKMKVEKKIRRLQEIVENCDEKIRKMEQDKKTKKSMLEEHLSQVSAAKDNLSQEILDLRNSLNCRIKTINNLMRERKEGLK